MREADLPGLRARARVRYMNAGPRPFPGRARKGRPCIEAFMLEQCRKMDT